MHPEPQLLIFDFDGTLADTRLDLCAAMNSMRRHYGLRPLPPSVLSQFIGDGMRSFVLQSLQGHPCDIDEAMRIYYRAYLRGIRGHTALYPGVARGLCKLQACGHALAIATNKNSEPTHLLLDSLGIARFFTKVICGDSGLPMKPAPDTVLETMRAFGSTPSLTWVIGDNHTDLGAARNAGVRSVFVAYGIGSMKAEKPDLVFSTFTPLTRFFCGGPGSRP